MTAAALIKAKNAIDRNKTYSGIAFFKDQKPRDFRGDVLVQELKSLKNSLSDADIDTLLGGIAAREAKAEKTAIKAAEKTEASQTDSAKPAESGKKAEKEKN